MDETTLAEKLSSLIENGTEEEVRAFIVEHFMEFPEEVRGEFAMEMVTESLEDQAASLENIADIKEKAAKLIAFADGETTEL